MSKTQHQEGMGLFYQLLAEAEKKDEMKALFECFFTQEELQALSLRVHLVKALLAEELSQREISKRLNVSISKITRGSNQLKTITRSFGALLKRVLLQSKA
jgi:TrpR family transcriptional regulator, trp operon repressor